MTSLNQPLPDFLAEPSRLGEEISVTGKWVPTKAAGRFRRSTESEELLQEWDDIHAAAASDPGVLSTEVNHAVGEDAVLVHHVFADAEGLVGYFETTARQHMGALAKVASPGLQLIRGTSIPVEVQQAVAATGAPRAFAELLFGYVRDDYRRPDTQTSVQVTAKWTCAPGSSLDELRHWWQQVGTDAHSMEAGLLRFEAYQVIGEDALVIHETFADSSELKFHLTKGTAEKYKSDIDKVAAPECYYFRGPVSWTIRTYSRFMHLPATYSSRGRQFTRPGGTMSEGTTGS